MATPARVSNLVTVCSMQFGPPFPPTPTTSDGEDEIGSDLDGDDDPTILLDRKSISPLPSSSILLSFSIRHKRKSEPPINGEIHRKYINSNAS